MKRAMIVMCFDVDETFNSDLQQSHAGRQEAELTEDMSDAIRGLVRTHHGASFPHGRVMGFQASEYDGPAIGSDEGPPDEGTLIKDMDEHMFRNLVRHHAPGVLLENLVKEAQGGEGDE